MNKRKDPLLQQRVDSKKGGEPVKGYPVPSGYMGHVDGQYMLFATEADYYEYMAE